MITITHKNILFNVLTQHKFRVWRHLFFIILFIPIGLSQSFFMFSGSPEISERIIYGFGIYLAVAIIALVYFNIYFLAVHYLAKDKYATYIIALLISVSCFVLLNTIGEHWIFSNAGITRGFNWIILLDGLSDLVLYTICVASGSITLLFKRWLAGNAMIERLENKQLKNSIEEVINRINPKFLYATLDYASKKVKSEPNETSDTLFKLGELLRYQLYDCKRNKVVLESDIEFIRNYLILEQQNSENRFSFTIVIEGNSKLFIPPALFIPWIEEIMPHHPQELHVKFDISDCAIKFECKTFQPDLRRCDFTKIERKLKLIYANDIAINKNIDSISLQIKIC